jgi:hypothetical protein
MEEISEDELAEVTAAPQMEEISIDELDAVMRAPQSKPRKPRIMERSYHNWFYSLNHSYSKCSNPDCIDPRGTDSAMVAEVNGEDMCRFCFLAGWNQAESTE